MAKQRKSKFNVFLSDFSKPFPSLNTFSEILVVLQKKSGFSKTNF